MTNRLRVENLKTWDEFLERIKALKQKYAASMSGLLYRGHGNSEWSLATTLERLQFQHTTLFQYYNLISRIRNQVQTFTETRWEEFDICRIEALLRDYDEFSLALVNGQLPQFSYMVYLRHHGFPSPLLDWTRAPHVAAYFAFARANKQDRVAIYILIERGDNRKLRGPNLPMIYGFGPYTGTHRRHYLQQSEYTMCIQFDGPGYCNLVPHETILDIEQGDQDIIYKITLPATERFKVLSLCDECNLNGYSLFGSEESLMETLTFREMERRAHGG